MPEDSAIRKRYLNYFSLSHPQVKEILGRSSETLLSRYTLPFGTLNALSLTVTYSKI